jgi:hypothetical protein
MAEADFDWRAIEISSSIFEFESSHISQYPCNSSWILASGQSFVTLNEEDFSARPIILRKQSGMRVFLAIFLEDADKTKFANPVS